MVDGNMQCNLRAKCGLETRECIWEGHFLTHSGSRECNHTLAGIGTCAAAGAGVSVRLF